MNNSTSSKTKQNDEFEDDDIFDDSSFLANFDNSFKQKSKLSESNINNSFNKNALNVSALCCDEEISGYDKLTGKTWIYPTNYPVRDYQFNIIKAAILKNTLVSLPTGLGKTFIAAVIMYNFYRWYPLGKIVFTAPTRPLVAQQIEACYNIIAIPPNDTIEMTGHMNVNTRKAHWQSKRVFFATPQVIYNDMKSGICPCDKIRCLVIDEAHRARGNYAYCQIVSTLDDMGHKVYRLLALSATPGSKVEDVINVVRSLHIAHLELRTENCIDVAAHSHARSISTVVVPLSQQLTALRQQYVEILDGYARRLKQLNILPHNLGNLSKGRIVMLYKEFQNKDRTARHPQHNYIMKDFTLLIALYHGLELLVQHGCRVFLNFFDEHPEKSWIQSDDRLTALLEMLRDDLGINPLSLNRSILPDGTIPEMPKDLCFGHPKFDKLKEIMINHFKRAETLKQDTRAIVFCEYRESVNLVHCLLLQCRPLIKPEMFVGQGASGKDGKTVVSQKQQLRVMRNFREGVSNTLVATCVAEEGLDVGSVDLILCFDISTRSPIRLVQRCGRTGRERGGQVFILVTEGREHQTLLECMRQRDGLNKKILQSRDVQNNLYKLNPRMMPRDHTPTCQKMFITVDKKQDHKDKSKETTDKTKKGQKDLRSMLVGRASTSAINSTAKELDNSIITEKDFNDIFPAGYEESAILPKPKEYWTMNKDAFKSIPEPKESELKLSRWLEWQRKLQDTVNIHHSTDSEILADLLRYADVQRFERPASQPMPCTIQESPTKMTLDSQKAAYQSPAKSKQIKKTKKATIVKSPAKKDGDIRALFSTNTKSTKDYTKLINDLGIQNDGSIPTKLIGLLVDLSLENTNAVKSCYICENICDCSIIHKARKPKKSPALLASLKEPTLPDINLINDFDAESILACAKKSDDIHIDDSMTDERLNKSINFDLELDFILPNDSKSVADDEPKSCDVTVNSGNFDVGDIEDIFADSSPEEAIIQDTEVVEKPKEPKIDFNLDDSIEDMFADDEIDNTPPEPTNTETKTITQSIKQPKTPNVVQTENPLSPSILSGRITSKPLPTSPILNTQVRKFQLSTKKARPHSSTPLTCRKQLIKEPVNNNPLLLNKDIPRSSIKDSFNDTTNKSMFTITQLVDMINKTDGNASTTLKANTPNVTPVKDNDKSASPILQTQRLKSPILSSQARANMSPILLTQTERRRASVNLNNSVTSTQAISQTKRSESLIILDSDSDSDSTQIYNAKEEIQSKTKDFSVREHIKAVKNFDESGASPSHNRSNNSPVGCKRKLDMDDSEAITASPYFNKKPKPNSQNDKQDTLQKKLLSFFKNDNTTLNCIITPTKNFSQKENRNPQFLEDDEKFDGSIKKNNLSMLQIFRRDSKFDKKEINGILKPSPVKNGVSQKRKLGFDDSEDEFVTDDKTQRKNQPTTNGHHKVRKKKKKHNSFLDTEAELSGGDDRSGDELSDDSIGSIVDFICDDSAVPQEEDIQAVYLKSIKSPFKAGAFKIPELPKKYNREDILSQYVEEDAYEMDSFCVDSNIGLTQVNEVSELELAEIILEEKRKSKKKSRRKLSQQEDSPNIKPISKPKRRQIHSDSDDSD